MDIHSTLYYIPQVWRLVRKKNVQDIENIFLHDHHTGCTHNNLNP